MARLLGVEIPDNKRTVIGLTTIYGIGVKTAAVILAKCGVDSDKRFGEMSSEEVKKVVKEINDNHKVEGVLKSEVMLSIKRKMDIGSYQGIRHRSGRLTVRGQRTKNNGRTKRGAKKNTIKNKKG